jgi:hypothetical protein
LPVSRTSHSGHTVADIASALLITAHRCSSIILCSDGLVKLFSTNWRAQSREPEC